MVVAPGRRLDFFHHGVVTGKVAGTTEGAGDDGRQPLTDLQFVAGGRLETLHERRPFEPRHHVGQLAGDGGEIVDELPLLLDRCRQERLLGRLSPLPFPARKGADGRRRQAERALPSAARRGLLRRLLAIPGRRSLAIDNLRRRGKRRWILRSAGRGLSPWAAILADTLRRLPILGACLPLPFARLALIFRA